LRRPFVLVCLLAAFVAQGAPGAGAAATAAGRPPDDPARGLVYQGIRRTAPNGPCRGNFELPDRRDRAGRVLCTHGPDPAPPGVDVRRRRDFLPVPAPGAGPPVPAAAGPAEAIAAAGAAGAGPAPAPGALTPATAGSPTAAAGAAVCDGDGSSGFRVQLLYVHAADVADRYGSLAASFQQWAGNLDAAFNNSAAETGGTRHVRFVHDASCSVSVTDVTVSATGDDDFDNTLAELRSKGYSRTDRKYLAWVDAYRYCGIAQVYYDDRPTADNDSNGSAAVPGELGRVDAGCWGLANSSEAHELMHTLGAVQTSAPHATSRNHCTDEYDRMCYSDGSGATVQVVCPSSHEALFDCNHDDYYSTAGRSSYLATHWNTANNVFLVGAGTQGTTTTATTPTTLAATTTTRPPPATTTTVGPGTTTTTPPPGSTPPSAPRSLVAGQPASGPGVVLSWSPPSSSGSGPVSSYRIYRGTGPTALGLLATIGPTTTYTDATAAHYVLYYYQVAAVNSAGEGPRSTLSRMVGR
jgi:hypothetical protein